MSNDECSTFVLAKERKEDRERMIVPKLLFPLKEWLWSFLPGHSFIWDFEEEEERQMEKLREEEMKPIHNTVKMIIIAGIITDYNSCCRFQVVSSSQSLVTAHQIPL